MRSVKMVATITVGLCLYSCSNDQTMSAPKERAGVKSDRFAAGANSQGVAETVAGAKSGVGAADIDPAALGTAGAESGADASGAASEQSKNDGSAALAAIMTDCGFAAGENMPEPTQILFQKSLRSQAVTISGTKTVTAASIGLPVLPFGRPPVLPPASYTTVVKASVDVSASMSVAKQTLRIGIESFAVSMLGFTVPPSLGQADAQKEVQANNSDTTSNGPESTARLEMIGREGPWKGIYCTVNPTKSMTTAKNGMTKTVTFDPPIPGGVWVKASPARFKAEIGSGRTFTNVKATVDNSSDSSLPAGTVVTGTVTVTPISGSLSENGVNADIAYMIRNDFGAQTVNLGLTPSQSFYVTSSDKVMRAIVVETGNAQMPRLVLSGQ